MLLKLTSDARGGQRRGQRLPCKIMSKATARPNSDLLDLRMIFGLGRGWLKKLVNGYSLVAPILAH